MGFKNFLVNLAPNSLVKVFAGPYVAGDSIELAISTAKTFWDSRKINSTIDLLGEELDNDDDVKYTLDLYLRLLDQLGTQEFASISLKPTQLGSHKSEETCQNNIARILQKAEEKQIPVTLDMEDHPFTDLTLRIFHNLKKEFPSFGTVLQSRLFRTTDDILSLKGMEARIRICIGIYNEPPNIALQNKPEMKKKVLEHVELLFKEGHYPEIATHDEKLIDDSIEIAERLNMPKSAYEVQMLMGVPRKDYQDNLVANGVMVRLYVPFAEEWKYATNYCKRRLAANPMMAAYVAQNIFAQLRGKK